MNYAYVAKGVLVSILFIFILIFLLLIFTPDISQFQLTHSFEDIKSLLQTGDIICFCGCVAEHFLVRIFTNCPISHVAMVFRDSWNNDCGKLIDKSTQEDDIYIFESTNNSEIDVLTQLHHRNGPVLELITEKFKNYTNYRYVWIKLRNYMGLVIDHESMLGKIKELNGHMFNDDVWSWVQGIWFGKVLSERKGKFCSQTLIELYNHLGVTNEEHPYSFIPSNFHNKEIKMINNWFFCKNIVFSFV